MRASVVDDGVRVTFVVLCTARACGQDWFRFGCPACAAATAGAGLVDARARLERARLAVRPFQTGEERVGLLCTLINVA